ncbi:hypothetical protein PG997_010394 [Apiospora hydei]|uniref:Nudix hydrolase domain-containing protein n=1 Tax=Apiospora hydei TaxID=1337664 RepID=A0ABR1VWU3_9PEZI
MKSQIKPSMSHLNCSRDQFLAHINKTADPPFDKLTIGAAILRDDGRILLLRRRPDEKHYPNVYEIPGGKVDETDPTIGQSHSSRGPRGVNSQPGTRNVIQLSYVVKVEDTQFQLNPDEHSEGVWATMGMLGELEITDDMKGLIMEALASTQ